MKCPECSTGTVQLIPAAETGLRVHVFEKRYPTSYAATVAACNRCEYAASIVETATRGVGGDEMSSSIHGEPAAPEMGKFFDMFGYDMVAQVQHASDDYVRYFILTNNSDHLLIAEAHAASEPSAEMQEPAKLVASYAYGENWQAAYRLALAETVRLSGLETLTADPEACPGCGCKPGDGITAACNHPEGCGYFKQVAPAARGTEAAKLQDISRHPDARD